MKRVSFVTNYIAPYRRPVWRALGKRTILSVHPVENSSRQREADNRPEEWQNDPHDVGYEVVNLPARSLVLAGEPRYFAFSGILGTVTSSDCLVLGGWESPIYWQLRVVASICRRPTVGFYESTLDSQAHSTGVFAVARHTFFRSLDAVVVPGIASEEAVLAMGVDARRIHRGFNAVDVKHIAAVAEQERVNNPSPVSGQRFIYIGQLIERKNVELIISAFATLSAQSSLTIVGVGRLRTHLEDLCETLGVAERVAFVGGVESESVPLFLSRHSTLVLASKIEVWGLVVNEALAAGLHVVVSRNCGVAKDIKKMRGVFLCDNSFESLSMALEESGRSWQGPIRDPEILDSNPEAFAEVFFESMGIGH